ncbi:MAG: DUF1080 domain-containing protein [Acidobacteria bacterium]|nr:DUF1080 domain-containing protein [Acidobacteriota bacterium]
MNRVTVLLPAVVASVLLAWPWVLVAQPSFSPAEEVVVTPTDTIQLFNGKDLSPFYGWLVGDHYADPSRVFSVAQQVDGAPAIRISGEKYGGIVTRQRYRRYRLIVEFRWGLLTWAPRLGRPRDSGVLVHAEGADGNTRPDFNGAWMRSIEAQIIEGGTGDFILVAGFEPGSRELRPSMTATVESDRKGQPVYAPQGAPRQFTGGRINWYGRDPDRTDLLGFRGVQDVESPAGQWTRLEVVVEDDRITNIVNGRIVNVGTAPSLKEGRIIIQSEGAEIYVRRIELSPLTPPTHSGR